MLDASPSKSKDDRGIVTVETKGFNQHGEEVCYFRRKLMVWKRDHAATAAPLRRRRLGLSFPPTASAAFERVLGWGVDHRRQFPWRTTRDPWAVLVSEIMLQQTQADRVVPYYGAFLAEFPTPTACAAAPVSAVLRLWSGLGYNRRGLNLHRAASVIALTHGGTVPHDDAALRALPGVGVYTARAVRAFAFADPVAPVDTNVARVLSRCIGGAALTVPEKCQGMADALVPATDSWAFNQTMFDVGALICTGTRPACAICPLRQQCRWKRRGLDEPDPWRSSPSARPQSRFAGSDRQGRGRLMDALRQGAVAPERLAQACGWPDDPDRAARITAALVAEGLAEWSLGNAAGATPMLTLP